MTPPAFVTSGTTVLIPGLSRACQPLKSNHTSPIPTKHASKNEPFQRLTMSAARKFFVGGNWKCNLNKATIGDLVDTFNAASPLDATNVEVVVAPPNPYLHTTRATLRKDFAVSGQNAWISSGGAFTGETDAAMLKDVGADWVILGHSERRHIPILKESDATIAKKAAYALSIGLKVIYCIGELLEEREAGSTLSVCQRQLAALAENISDWKDVVIAYEPVWAIGTGKVASPEQAEEVHVGVRKWLETNVSKHVADETRILYGGSVSSANCDTLAKQNNIDGFLVGGASLKASFLEIVDSYKAALAASV